MDSITRTKQASISTENIEMQLRHSKNKMEEIMSNLKSYEHLRAGQNPSIWLVIGILILSFVIALVSIFQPDTQMTSLDAVFNDSAIALFMVRLIDLIPELFTLFLSVVVALLTFMAAFSKRERDKRYADIDDRIKRIKSIQHDVAMELQKYEAEMKLQEYEASSLTKS